MDLSKFTNGKGDKVVQYVQGNWLTYRDAVEYSSRFLRKGIVILANADIHFDRSQPTKTQNSKHPKPLALNSKPKSKR